MVSQGLPPSPPPGKNWTSASPRALLSPRLRLSASVRQAAGSRCPPDNDEGLRLNVPPLPERSAAGGKRHPGTGSPVSRTCCNLGSISGTILWAPISLENSNETPAGQRTKGGLSAALSLFLALILPRPPLSFPPFLPQGLAAGGQVTHHPGCRGVPACGTQRPGPDGLSSLPSPAMEEAGLSPSCSQDPGTLYPTPTAHSQPAPQAHSIK